MDYLKRKMFFVNFFVYLMAGSAVYARITILGGLAHDKTVQPGEEVRGEILVRNQGDTPQGGILS